MQGDDAAPLFHWDNNARHVVSVEAGVASAVLDGFTISGGYAFGVPGVDGYGAGLWAPDAACVLAHCTFTQNRAVRGGGAYLGSTPFGHTTSIHDCSFANNFTSGGSGGGLYATAAARLELDGCSLSGNFADGWGEATSEGGGMFIEAGAQASIRNTLFFANLADSSSTDYSQAGGGLCNHADGVTLDGCVFDSNTGGDGAALWTSGDITVSNSVFRSSNGYSGYVGAVTNVGNVATYVGCTIAGSTVADGSAIANVDAPLVRVRNCILWGNGSWGFPTPHAQVHDLGSAVSEIHWSLVQYLFDTLPGQPAPDPADYPGCLAVDPLLDAGLHLLPGSPARDAGRNDFVPAGQLEDAAGLARFHEDPAAPNLGVGTPPLADMGAFEAGSPVVWTLLGGGTPHGEGCSYLRGAGSLMPSEPGRIRLTHVMPGTAAVLLLSTTVGNQPWKNGLLKAWPVDDILWYWIAGDDLELAWAAWPAGASGLELVLQFGLGEPSAWKNASLSNALVLVVP
jgi:predicted outer membrane repeat protein